MNRLPFLDYIKFIAITLVLVYHSGASYWGDYARPIISMCVPLFFVASGFARANKIYDLKRTIANLVKIAALFVLWGVLSTLCTYLVKGDSLNIKDIIIDSISLRLGYDNHLWFLVTFGIISVFHLLLQKCSKSELVFVFSLVFICTIQGFERFVRPFNPLSGWHSYALAYYLAGMLINRYSLVAIKQSGKVWALTIFILAYIWQCYYNSLWGADSFIAKLFRLNETDDVIFGGYKTIGVFCMVTSLFILLKSLKLKRNVFVEYVSLNVLGIYLLHEFVLKPLSLTTFVSPVKFIICYSLTLGLVFIFNKNQILKRLITI